MKRHVVDDARVNHKKWCAALVDRVIELQRAGNFQLASVIARAAREACNQKPEDCPTCQNFDRD
jgi:hypothetical protein